MSLPKNTHAEIIDQKIWIKSGEETWAYDLIDISLEGQRRKKMNSATPNLITAPMPGKITKVFVRVGDAVAKGQALLVMEAMKMEYTLKSDLDTIVDKIHIELNQQLPLGFLMVELKLVESND